ncbi:hypothetical protein [Photobacterium damselae]|uniref:hypothetical protein n=1 Tax=Photobacterium damselae TaxID=38293 RepID=UPI001CB71DE3|nr:hypothetical protein [Photobacterium damselae]
MKNEINNDIPIHRDLKEAYLHETLSEVFRLNQELLELRTEAMMRIGITQDMIEQQLAASREVLNNYTKAANAHFTAKKEELSSIAEKELTNALVQAHKQLLISNPPKIGFVAIIPCALLSGAVSAFVSIFCLYFLSR